MIDRIVILNDLAEAKGGASALAIDSAIAFAAAGLPVTFLSGDAGINAQLEVAGIMPVGLGQDRLLARSRIGAATAGLFNRAAFRLVADWIAANDTPGTIYHLHGWAQILSPAVFAALQPVRDRLVLSAHDFFLACPTGSYAMANTGDVCRLVPLGAACVLTQCDRRSYAHKLWRVARQTVQRHYFDPAHAPTVLAIHEGMRPFLLRGGIPDAAIVTLPNPVTAFTATRIDAANNQAILFVGRLEESKGIDLALAAARLAGATLHVIGDGALRRALERDYPEMRFLGHRTKSVIAGIARDARLLVMPSRYPEPFGLVAVEALWSGLPVLLADTALMAPDIVALGAGFAVAPRDIGGFAALLRRLMADDAMIDDASRNAYSRTQGIALSPERWIADLIGIYDNVLDRA